MTFDLIIWVSWFGFSSKPYRKGHHRDSLVNVPSPLSSSAARWCLRLRHLSMRRLACLRLKSTRLHSKLIDEITLVFIPPPPRPFDLSSLDRGSCVRSNSSIRQRLINSSANQPAHSSFARMCSYSSVLALETFPC